MMHMQNTKLARFRFDWEPLTRKLYIVPIDVPTHQLIGELICENVETPETAQLVVSAWCNGYMAKELEQSTPFKPQHFRMLAETGQHGAQFGPRFSNGDGR